MQLMLVRKPLQLKTERSWNVTVDQGVVCIWMIIINKLSGSVILFDYCLSVVSGEEAPSGKAKQKVSKSSV